MAAYADLLRAVLAEPQDDAPRLILADWLDEQGEGDRAEFIRCQCALARRNPRYCRQSTCNQAGYGPCNYCSDTDALSRRERELTAPPDRLGEWLGARPGLATFVGAWPDDVGWLYKRSGENATAIRAEFRRGFVAVVRCRLEDWIGEGCKACRGDGWQIGPPERSQCPRCKGTGSVGGHGPAVVRAHPVERVEVTDREPYLNLAGTRWRWFRGFVMVDVRAGGNAAGFLLPSVFAMLGGGVPNASRDELYYPTRDTALDALSAALLAHARGVR
jgi:uncharacterized protein (TIGR02996 family)